MARGKSETLKAGQHRVVFTSGVNDRIVGDNRFAEFVWKSVLRFNRADWGKVGAEDWKANDEALKSLNNGGWYGMILGVYISEWLPAKIYIIRNTAEEDGTQAITVLFPNEY